MKSWVCARRPLAGIVSLVFICLSSTALANVGRTVGTYAVSPTGASTYTIPIWAPRGPNGLKPNISLIYNSQQSPGYLGVGWSLAGISVISRCNRTVAQDGTAAPVALATNDALCLDGQRLQLTGGTYGEAGSTYQTEVANFEQVTAYGSAGNGPQYFIVRAPNGTQYRYGYDGGSQVIAYQSANGTASAWYLDTVTDSAGNTMTFSYTSAGDGSVVPTTISWTPSSSGAGTYNYTMQFAYGTNSAASSYYGYIGGTEVTNTDLLKSVTVDYEGSTVKQYSLTYTPSATTNAETLTTIEECADTARSNCLAPTALAYQSPPIGTSSTATVAASGGSVINQVVWSYDFNGDGQDDLAYCNSSGSLQVAFASSSGYETPISTGIPCSLGAQYGDLLGTGQDGILADKGGTWYYYQWDGSEFTGQSTGLAYDSNGWQFALADVNGDGRPDLVELTQNAAATQETISVRLNTSSASDVSFGSSSQWYSLSAGGVATFTFAEIESRASGSSIVLQTGDVKRLDFNGDGRDDLAFEYRTQTCIMVRGSCTDTYKDSANELVSTGSSFAGTQVGTQTTLSAQQVAFFNFNSDACTDLMYGSTIYVSGCNGQPASTVTVPSSSIVGVMDWNADGRADILVNNGGTIGVYESTGTGLGGLITTSIPYNSLDQYFGFDPAGDQLDALGAWEDDYTSFEISYYSHQGDGVGPDLLTTITDGYGNSVSPTYVSIARSVGSTYFETNDAEYPYENYLGPLYVVNQTTFSDPSNPPNGTYQVNDYYSGAWMNLQGRGFAGFVNVQTYDGRNGIWDTLGYDRSFPFTGMLTGEVKTQNNTEQELILDLSYSFGDTVLDSTEYDKRDFPYVSNSTRKDYEVGGTENTELIKTTTGSYSYDNYGNLTSASQTTTDNDSGSPYDGDSWTQTITNTPDPDTNTWCLGLLSESQISYSASDDSASVTRTRDYTPDTTDCHYTQIVTAPSTSYQVTEGLVYDDFGNIKTDTVTGTGMTARVTSANWGTTGQFPMSVTDASGAETQFNYNFSYGLVSSESDPNGLTTSWQYSDGFGRVTQETRPDGTYTVLEYNSCADANGCLFGSNTLALSHYLYSSSGSLENNGTTTYDQVGRPYVSNDLLMGGTTWNRVDTRYDSLGRVVERSMPCLWSSMSDPCPYAVTYGHDILNRVTQVQRPISQSDSTLQTTSYAYAGDVTTITDPNEHTRTLTKDVMGWLSRTTDALGYSVNLGYDAAGSKTSVTDSLGNQLWTGTYAYGISAFLTGETDKDRGTWGYTVDALGERTAWTDAKGQQFHESYDALSRPLTRTEPDLFTQWTWGSSAANHNIGKLASVCSGTGSACSSSYYSESEAYDSLGRLSQRSIAIPSMGTYTYTWQYSATTGLLSTLTYPVSTSGKSLELQYAYQNGILQSIKDILDSPNVTIWQADAQNPAGQITQETLGNGLVTTRTYDAVTHWLSAVQSAASGGSLVQNQSFLYDEVGNVTQRQDNNLGLSEDFYYDNDNRLSHSTLNGTQNLSLTYDQMGDITNRSDVASNATWSYDATHIHQVREAGSTAYEYVYDANGNMTSRQGGSITWSSYNYPTSVNDSAVSQSVSFSYGPDRTPWFEETQTTIATELAYHVGGLFDIVTSQGVTDYRHYIYAGNEPVAIVSRESNGSNPIYYLLTDHQGSIAAITNSAGGVVVGESFTAYGNRRNPSTWSGAPSTADLITIASVSRHGYTFQDSMAGLMGLNDMVGRVQDAITGRFLSADPTIPDPSDPQSYNRYSYTINNPLTYTDPTGFTSFEDCWDDDCESGGQLFGDTSNYAPPQSEASGSAGGGGGGGANGNGGNGGSSNGNSGSLPGGWTDLNYQFQVCFSSDGLACSPDDSASALQSNQPLSFCDNGNSPCLNEITVNGIRTIVPDNVFQTPSIQNFNFPCGGFQCAFQMGQYVPTGESTGARGVYLNLSVNGNSNGKWAQTWVATNASFNTDNASNPSSPFYTSDWSNGWWFFDDPSRPENSVPMTWLAQLSYLLPSGAAFTLQWGFTLTNGTATPIAPVLVTQPWAPQQTLINKGQGAP
ncbi:MAG: SpvB/TcaC N-terminal domain-containing protein [Steroidobacteraceae bacterium]